MLRLSYRELVITWRSWWPTAAVIVLASTICGVAAIARDAVVGMAQGDAESTASYGAALIGLTLATAFVVVGVAVDLAIGAGRRRLALLALNGLTPSQAASLVYAQAAYVALPSIIVGEGMALLAARPAARFVVEGAAQTAPGALASNSMKAVATAGALVLVAAVLAASKGARQAKRVRPLEALRETEPPAPQRSRLRRLVTVLSLVMLAMTALVSIGTPVVVRFLPPSATDTWQPSAPDTAVSSGTFACIAATVFLAASAPRYAPLVLRSWTRIVPAHGVPTWHIARTLASEHLGRSTAAVTLITVATTVSAGLFSVLNTGAAGIERAAGTSGSTDVNYASIVTLLAGPFLLALVGAALTAISSQRDRLAELTGVQLGGATFRQLTLIAVLEICMYAGTSAIVALVASAGLAAIVGLGFASTAGFVIRVAAAPILAVPTLAAALLALAVLPALWRQRRRPVLTRLMFE